VVWAEGALHVEWRVDARRPHVLHWQAGLRLGRAHRLGIRGVEDAEHPALIAGVVASEVAHAVCVEAPGAAACERLYGVKWCWLHEAPLHDHELPFRGRTAASGATSGPPCAVAAHSAL